jgi:HEAT repeat protein
VAQPDDPVANDRKRSEWVELLKSKSAEERAKAAEALGEMRWFVGPGRSALVTALAADPEAKVRANAAGALGKIADPRGAVPALIAALRDDDLSVRTTAARSLGNYGPKAAPAAPVLATRLKDKNDWDAMAAAIALTRIDPIRDDGIRLLVALSRDPKDRDLQSFALGGLVYELDHPELLSRHIKIVAPALLALLKDEGGPEKDDNVKLRRTAVYGLAVFRPALKEAMPDLTAALKDRDKYVRLAAIEALSRMDPKNADIAKALVSELKVVDKFFPDRFNAMDAVMLAGKLGVAAKDAVPELIALLQAGNKIHVQVQEMAQYALGRIGPAAKAALPLLTPDLKVKDRTDRYKAARAVLGIDPMHHVALGIVKDVALTPDGSDGIDLRMDALGVLTEFPAERATTIRAMTAALQAPGEFEKRDGLSIAGRVYATRKDLLWYVQVGCVRILGTCGADGKEAVPALVAALNDRQVEVRVEAAEALEKLDAAALRAALMK